MNPRLNRRSVLKGVGLGAGAVLLSPVLSQLTAHAAGAASVTKKRFVFVMEGNGLNPLQVQPTTIPRAKGAWNNVFVKFSSSKFASIINNDVRR